VVVATVDNQIVVADAAALLGVNVQRVRALLAAGELSGTKVGSVWLVDPVSLATYRHVRQPRGGRALAPNTAWAALLSRFAAGVAPEICETFDVKNERRRRLLALAGRDVDDWRWLARRRADVQRYNTRPAYLDRLRATPGLVCAGLSATTAAAAGLTETSARFDAYAAGSTIERLVREFSFRPAEDGNVTLRAVALEGARLAVVLSSPLPDLVIAVDLIEDRDERTSAAGRELFREASRGRR
jgi:hypothetical protein